MDSHSLDSVGTCASVRPLSTSVSSLFLGQGNPNSHMHDSNGKI